MPCHQGPLGLLNEGVASCGRVGRRDRQVVGRDDELTYAIQEIVAADAHATVYRALRRSDHRLVLLKALEEADDVGCLQNELALAGSLDRSKVLRPLSLATHEGKPALVREGFPGIPLERLLDRPIESSRFVQLALAITSALEYVHRAGLIHRDLTPRSIYVRSDTSEARLSEFGRAARIPRQPEVAQSPELIEGLLPYMSPEQTGRTNRKVDSRSDLYSLGVVFFQMLTAELPFAASDAPGWIHAHVARPAPSPRDLSPAVPPILADIVLHLLAKVPEARYQSARGVRHDLERARDSLEAGHAPFPLGEHDVSEQLMIPQHLYGREAGLERLRRALHETTRAARPALALVSGSPGVGKSSLVHELLRSIEHTHGTLLSGKFDALQRNIPYSTVTRMFQALLRDLVPGGGEGRSSPWRERLRDALDLKGSLVADIIPEVELLLGPQPPVPPLPPAEAELRFRRVLAAFIAAFARPECPLVLFLDDLQWADIASLKLLHHVLMQPGQHPILIIGAYRANDVAAGHPLAQTISDARAAGVSIAEVAIKPLGLEHVVALTADSVRRPALDVRPLAQLVYEKTAGNPFFIIQFLNELTRDGLLAFDAHAWRWRWDLEAIRRRDYTDNVADFMVERVARLPAKARGILRLAACVGNICDATTLATIAQVDESALERELLPALELGLLVPGHHTYRFAHDRVQQAAYSLLPEATRPEIHLRIGRLMWTDLADATGDRLFEIVNQLNRGITLLTDQTERVAVARLNLAAGRRARDAAAPAAAEQYARTAIELVAKDGWGAAYDLVLKAYLVRAECEFLLGHIDDAYRSLDVIEEHATDVMDRAPGRSLRSWFLTIQGRLIEATEYTVETARLLGMELPSPHDAAAVRRATAEAFEAFQAALADRSVESLAVLPELERPAELAVLDTIYRVIPAVFQWNTDLHALLVLKSVLLASPEHTAPAFFYAQYGIIHSALTGDHDTAFRFGQLAIRLAERPRDRPTAGATHFVYATFLAHRKRHISVSVEHLRIGLRLSLEAGDLVQANFCRSLEASYRLYAGETLETIRADVDDRLEIMRRAGDVVNGGVLTTTNQAILALQGRTPSLACLNDAGFDEEAFEATAVASVLAHHGSLKAMVRFVGGDPGGALEAADAFAPLPGVFLNAWQRLYRGLALARRAAAFSGHERTRCRERLDEDSRFLAQLAVHCPANHGHRDKLLRAEIAMLDGDTLDALRLYDAAVEEAREGGFSHELALGHELASRALRACELRAAADLHLNEARRSYRAWGAEGKVRQLERLFPSRPARRPPPADAFAEAIRAQPESLDMLAVVKAAQAIAGELTWESVTQRLLEVAIEHSGASYGCLLLRRNRELLVAACARAEARRIITERGDMTPLGSPPVVATSIAHAAARSQEPIIVDADEAGDWYSRDAYLRAKRPGAVLCLPVLRRVEVSALLYLENQQVSGAFTREHLTALELIAAQAEIALANAELFEKLERENAERRRAEVFLQQIIDNSSAVIFVKDREGRYLLANRQFDELFRMAREDIIGKTDRALMDPEMIEVFRDHDRLALEANRPIEFEEQFKHPEGARTYIALKFPLRDAEGQPFAVGGISTDITTRKRSEDELRRSVSLLKATLESTGDAIAVVDTDGRVVQFNQPFFEMWDAPPVGGRARDVDSPFNLDELRDPESFRREMRRLTENPDETSFRSVELADGRIFECYSQPQRMEERIVGRVWSFRDVTMRTRAERERDALLLREQQTRAAAEDAVRLRDEFLSVASHELRTPLTSLQLAVQGLSRRLGSEAPQAVQDTVDLATRQLRRLAKLVGLLLDVSRIQAGRLELTRRSVDLSQVVKETLAQLAEDIRRSGSELVARSPGPVRGEWDPSRIEQVLINLVTNAIKFGERKPIIVTTEAIDGVARLTVTDHGLGIPEEAQARVFERFGRGVSARHYGGLGLGLYIVRTIVEAHGGRVWVQSTAGQGASFTVELPRSPSQDAPRETA
jgi:PAS domain S-box-containing protein